MRVTAAGTGDGAAILIAALLTACGGSDWDELRAIRNTTTRTISVRCGLGPDAVIIDPRRGEPDRRMVAIADWIASDGSKTKACLRYEAAKLGYGVEKVLVRN